METALIAVPVRKRAAQVRLLVLHRGDYEVRVNGQKIPRAAVLKELDVLEWEPRFQFHVVLFGRPGHGAAPPQWIGRECPHCRTRLSENARCLVCAWCGTPLHDELDGKGLRCARERSV